MTDPEIQATFDYLFDLAQKALAQGGSFAPFATAHWEKSERTHSTADLDVADSTPQDHIAALIRVLHAETKSGAQAAGIAFDTKMTMDKNETLDAVGMHLESALGAAVEVFVPYRREGEALHFQEPIIVHVSRRIYPPA